VLKIDGSSIINNRRLYPIVVLHIYRQSIGMEALPECFLCVLRDMEKFEKDVTGVVASFREKRRVLTEAVSRSLGIPPPSDFSLPQSVFENESPKPPPRVAAALTGLGEVATTTLQTLKREAHSKLDQIVQSVLQNRLVSSSCVGSRQRDSLLRGCGDTLSGC